MNYKKINQDVIKAIFDGTKWGNHFVGYWVTEELLFFTFDGFIGYILPKDKIAFDLSYMQTAPKALFNLERMYETGGEIRATKTYVSDRYGMRMLRRFKGERDGVSWNVYIDEKYMKPVAKEDELIFTQEFDSKAFMNKKPVLISKKVNGDKIPLVFICPVAVYDESEFD